MADRLIFLGEAGEEVFVNNMFPEIRLDVGCKKSVQLLMFDNPEQ